jgi:hypothetical protein
MLDIMLAQMLILNVDFSGYVLVYLYWTALINYVWFLNCRV